MNRNTLAESFRKRFIELRHKADCLPTTESEYGFYYAAGTWQGWATSAQSLIKAVYGTSSPHYINFSEHLSRCNGDSGCVQILKDIFSSAQEDFEGGYVFSVDLKISGEVFGDFVVLAKESLVNGYKNVAAVLATAALEDSLKRYARANEIETDDRSLTEIINALKSKGLVSGAAKSLLGSMPRLRNAALHADWEKISEPEVSSIIGFVEQFLLMNFSQE